MTIVRFSCMTFELWLAVSIECVGGVNWVPVLSHVPFNTVGSGQETGTGSTATTGVIWMRALSLIGVTAVLLRCLLLLLLLFGQELQFDPAGRIGSSFGQVTALRLFIAIALGNSRLLNVVTVGHGRVLAI